MWTQPQPKVEGGDCCQQNCAQVSSILLYFPRIGKVAMLILACFPIREADSSYAYNTSWKFDFRGHMSFLVPKSLPAIVHACGDTPV